MNYKEKIESNTTTIADLITKISFDVSDSTLRQSKTSSIRPTRPLCLSICGIYNTILTIINNYIDDPAYNDIQY